MAGTPLLLFRTIKTTKFFLAILSFICLILSTVPTSFSQSLQEPKPLIHCSHDGNWYRPEEYSIYCKPKKPLPSVAPTSPSLPPVPKTQIQIFQALLQPIFSAIFDFNSFFSSESESLKGSHSKLIEEKKLQAEKESVFLAWQKLLTEAEQRAKTEMEKKKKEGELVLSKVRIGSEGLKNESIQSEKLVTKFDWDNPRAQKGETNRVESSEDKVKEDLLRTLYFSKMAETACLSGDLEAARFFATLAFEGDAHSPRKIEYNPPREILLAMDGKKAIEINTKLTRYSRFFRQAMPKFDHLSDIIRRIDDLSKRKREVEQKLSAIQNELGNRGGRSDHVVDEKSTYSETRENLEALLRNLSSEEERLLNEKSRIEMELDRLRMKIFDSG